MTFLNNNTVITAGFAVALLSGVLAISQDATAAVCRARTAGEGNGTGILGMGTQNAQDNAKADWSAKAAKRYGASFANFQKAKDARYDCTSGTVLAVKCTVTAQPCR